jgi:hypothetical protein
MTRILATSSRMMALVLAALLIGVLGAGPVSADDSDSDAADPNVAHREALEKSGDLEAPKPVPASTQTDKSGKITMKGTNYVVTCTPDAQAPHGSSGATKKGKYYIIAKVRVKCIGTGDYPGTVTIQVWSSLLWNKAKSKDDPDAIGGDWKSLAGEKDPEDVRVDGKVNTFYVPHEGKTGGTKTGLYQLSSTVTILKPTGQKVGRDMSVVRVCKVTKSSAGCTN